MGHGSGDAGCNIRGSFMLRGRNAGHAEPGELLARPARVAREASHGSQRCRAACPHLSLHPAPRYSGFIPHFSGQPRARDFPALSRDEPCSPGAAGGARNLQASYVWFLAILDTGSELPPLGGQGCNSPTLRGKAEKERNKRGGEAVRRGRGSRGFPQAPASASGTRAASGSIGSLMQGMHRSLGRCQAGGKPPPVFYDEVGALVATWQLARTAGIWDPLPDAGLLPSFALCSWSPAPSQCFVLFFPSSGCLLRERRPPVTRTPRAVLASAFLPRLCSRQGCSARCLPWERWCSAWQVSGAGEGLGLVWSACHHPKEDVLNTTFVPTKLPLTCGSRWQRPQSVSPGFVVLQLPRASSRGCDGFLCTWATLVAGDTTFRMLQLNGEATGGPNPEGFLLTWVCPHALQLLAPQVAAPQPGRDIRTESFRDAQQPAAVPARLGNIPKTHWHLLLARGRRDALESAKSQAGCPSALLLPVCPSAAPGRSRPAWLLPAAPHPSRSSSCLKFNVSLLSLSPGGYLLQVMALLCSTMVLRSEYKANPWSEARFFFFFPFSSLFWGWVELVKEALMVSWVCFGGCCPWVCFGGHRCSLPTGTPGPAPSTEGLAAWA